MKETRRSLKRLLSIFLVMTSIVALFSVPVSAEKYGKARVKKGIIYNYFVFKGKSQYYAFAKQLTKPVYHGDTKITLGCSSSVTYSAQTAFAFNKSIGVSVPVEGCFITANMTNGRTLTTGISKSDIAQYSWSLDRDDAKGYYYISAVVPFHKCKVIKKTKKGKIKKRYYPVSIDSNRETFVALLYKGTAKGSSYKIYKE